MGSDGVPRGGSSEPLKLTDVIASNTLYDIWLHALRHRVTSDWKVRVPLGADVHDSPVATHRIGASATASSNGEMGGNVAANVVTGVTAVPHAER